MSQKPWPLPARSAGDCGQEPKPSPERCGQAAKAKYEIDSPEVAQFKPIETTLKHKNLIPWKPGQSGNTAGRPKGSKHRITETMPAIVLADVTQNAVEALAQLRREDIVAYFAVIMKFVPTELLMKLEAGKLLDYSEMTDEELNAYYEKRQRDKMIESLVENLDTKYVIKS
jgi:hypothetical protein